MACISLRESIIACRCTGMHGLHGTTALPGVAIAGRVVRLDMRTRRGSGFWLRPEGSMKRIILCADGTWNVRDQVDKQTGKRRPTNVTKVARAVRPRSRDGIDQVVYYHDGVGTGGLKDRITGGAFGHGIEDNIRVLYRFLVYNYEPGDELFFFGFSIF